MRTLAVFLFPWALLTCGAERCDLPPGLAAFVRALPAARLPRMVALEERLKQTPEDIALNRFVVDLAIYHRRPVRERYQRLLEQHPGNLDFQYLYARSLVGSNTPEALRL